MKNLNVASKSKCVLIRLLMVSGCHDDKDGRYQECNTVIGLSDANPTPFLLPRKSSNLIWRLIDHLTNLKDHFLLERDINVGLKGSTLQ